MSYNGWTNRATWLVNLWLGDNLAEMVLDNREPMDGRDVETYVWEVVETSAANVADGLTQDLLSVALSDVNWNEIAEAASEGVAEDA